MMFTDLQSTGIISSQMTSLRAFWRCLWGENFPWRNKKNSSVSLHISVQKFTWTESSTCTLCRQVVFWGRNPRTAEMLDIKCGNKTSQDNCGLPQKGSEKNFLLVTNTHVASATFSQKKQCNQSGNIFAVIPLSRWKREVLLCPREVSFRSAVSLMLHEKPGLAKTVCGPPGETKDDCVHFQIQTTIFLPFQWNIAPGVSGCIALLAHPRASPTATTNQHFQIQNVHPERVAMTY